ncbi:acyl-CoA dehydrogenase [Actinomadura sp. KC216]|uniref:acyl-CoA dehydrogenase family protein n=1 Tax=Actinomadura sp. KC216 TaxID=2530370 RepID=UPI001050CC60|nr:acyl-CoA dehydrogenase family protein [Actinomadura sp. KC216]TDB91415.1 acyl-CoA dehydrogenase [Actinomadura sp. KC216]
MAGRAGLGGREVSEELLSPEEVRSALRAYFAGSSALDEARALRDDAAAFGEDGFDRDRWRALAGEVGLVAMAGPEEAGGLGLGLAHLTAALEEAGGCLYPGPVRASVLAAWTLGLPGASLPDGAEALLDGTAIVGMPQSFAGRRPEVVLSADGRVSGTVRAVTHGMSADVLLTLADSPQGAVPVLARLDGEDGDVARRRVPATDLTAALADLELRAVPATVAAPGDTAAHARARDAARLLLAAEQVGGAQGCLAHMVDYAKIRTQFGQVIGGYQAIQHRCARVAVAVAGARALVLAAAKAIDSGEGEAAHQLVLLAKAEASEAFDEAADALVQVHGGIGFTWEHDAHLYFRRARASSALDGHPSRLRDEAVTAGCLSLLTRAPAG